MVFILNPSMGHLEATPEPVSCRSPLEIQVGSLSPRPSPPTEAVNQGLLILSHMEAQKVDSADEAPVIGAAQNPHPHPTYTHTHCNGYLGPWGILYKITMA